MASKNENIGEFLLPVQQETATEIVARQLINLISSGVLTRKDKLPSERKLAEHLKVGRTTVREALKLLTLSGLLEAKRGDGTYVRENYWSFVAQEIQWPSLLRRTEVTELLEVRTPLEIQSAYLAALRASDEDLACLEAICQELADLPERDLERETELDLQFHRAIAVAGKNQLLVEVLQGLQAPLRSHIEQANRMTADKASTVQEHRTIYEALRQRDPEAATRAMSEHMGMSKFLALLIAQDGGDGEQRHQILLVRDG
jgi:GntR family transcriptional regulator, transcriptional repressor for pyruvate dehydrogenase complex